MKIELMKLPYSNDALAPHISAETISYHYGKHHQTYVTNLNNLLPGSGLEEKNLVDIVRQAQGPLFNNAAQVYNHDFYWQSLTPSSTANPTGEIANALNSIFGNFQTFKEEFTKSAISNFGSGWTWLVKDKDNKLRILNTSNAQTPITTPGQIPLLTCDVWEHAYYIDYRNARPQYLDTFWKLINWNFANANLQKSTV